jgi:hypothetical protein
MLTFHIDGKQTEVAEVTHANLGNTDNPETYFYYIIPPIRNTIHKELIQI